MNEYVTTISDAEFALHCVSLNCALAHVPEPEAFEWITYFERKRGIIVEQKSETAQGACNTCAASNQHSHGRTEMAIFDFTPNDVKRFWAKVDRSGGEDACWNWTAALDTSGYGNFKLQGRTCRASRLAYAISKGMFPLELNILHSCDNPTCCNPKHLSVGTHTDNMRDMEAKQRSRHPSAEKHGRHKLTFADVRAIRLRYAQGQTSHRTLAKEYSVSYGLIKQILDHKVWRDTEGGAQ